MNDPDRTHAAAAWSVNIEHWLESDATDLDLDAWQRWVSDPRNAAAYDALVSTIALMKAYGAPLPLPSEAECASDLYDGSMSVEDWLRRRKSPVSGFQITDST